MSDRRLRRALVKLAHRRPELRKDLVPLLRLSWQSSLVVGAPVWVKRPGEPRFSGSGEIIKATGGRFMVRMENGDVVPAARNQLAAKELQ